MSMDEIQSENEPTGPHPTATDRAVAAVERMMDASSRVSNAYADAYQEAVIHGIGCEVTRAYVDVARRMLS
jgi:hypothetical protein